MTITLSKIKSLERKAEAMRVLEDDFTYWSDEELERFTGIRGMESWSDEQLRNTLKGLIGYANDC